MMPPRYLHTFAPILGSLVGSIGCGGQVAGDAPHPSDAALPDSSASADAAVDSTAPSEAGSCAPGATRCAGKGVETCDSNGHWGAAVLCSQPHPDCSGGGCTCAGAVCSGVCTDLATDGKNCGGCGLSCSTGCTAGECIITLGPGGGPLALTSTRLYWGLYFGGYPPAAIMEAQLDSGAPTTFAAEAGADFIAVDSANLYWTSTNGGTVVQAPLDGGAPLTLATNQFSSASAPIAVDATSVYWAYGSLMKVPIGGGSVTTIAATCGVCGLVVSGAVAYCADDSRTVWSIPVDGGTPTAFATNQARPCIIAVRGGNVYWDNYVDGTVMTEPVGGGTPRTIATGPPMGVGATAIDDANIYFATHVDGGAIVRAPLDGGSPTLIAMLPNIASAAVSDTSVFVTSPGGLVKITPK